MIVIILANILSVIGCALLVYIGSLPSRKDVLHWQNIQSLIMAISNAMLGGIPGSISNLVAVARNLYSRKIKFHAIQKSFFIGLQFIITTIFNSQGLVGYMPFMAASAFTVVIDSNNIIVTKAALAVAQFCWLIFDLTILNVVGACFDIATILSNIRYIINYKSCN